MASKRTASTSVPRQLYLCLLAVTVYCALVIGLLFAYSAAAVWRSPAGRGAAAVGGPSRRDGPHQPTAGVDAPPPAEAPAEAAAMEAKAEAKAEAKVPVIDEDDGAAAMEAKAEAKVPVVDEDDGAAAEEEKKKKEENQVKRRGFLEKEPFMEDASRKPSTCPNSVEGLGRYSSWFRSRYRPKAKVFLDRDDAGNYTHLNLYRPPFGVGGMNDSFFSSLVSHPNFTNPPSPPVSSKAGCVRCAVVGCGGILNGSGAGPAIDSHDYVFRLNRAISLGRYGDDVGHKTTFYMFFPESEHVPDVTDKDAIFIYVMFKMYDARYAYNMLSDVKPPIAVGSKGIKEIRKPRVRPSKLKFVHPDFMRYVFANYLEGVAARPTTGALMVVLSLHLCDEVSIYGYGYDPRFTLHYYDRDFVQHTDASTALHDVDNERVLWRKLHEEGAIRLFKRDA